MLVPTRFTNHGLSKWGCHCYASDKRRIGTAAEEPMYIAGEGGHFYNAFVALDERNVCPSGYVRLLMEI